MNSKKSDNRRNSLFLPLVSLVLCVQLRFLGSFFPFMAFGCFSLCSLIPPELFPWFSMSLSHAVEAARGGGIIGTEHPRHDPFVFHNRLQIPHDFREVIAGPIRRDCAIGPGHQGHVDMTKLQAPVVGHCQLAITGMEIPTAYIRGRPRGAWTRQARRQSGFALAAKASFLIQKSLYPRQAFPTSRPIEQ
jgi:hypothetical protein